MVGITHILACECGHEQQCEPEDTRVGAVYRCDGCQTVWGRVTPRKGGRAWVHISETDTAFHGLLEEPTP